MKTKLILSILFFNSFFSFGTQLDELVEEIKLNLNLEILLDSSFKSTYKDVTYTSVGDTAILLDYLKLLKFEYSKYPEFFFDKIGINQIVVGQNLSIQGQRRAAIPDPYKKTLLFEVNQYYSLEYLVHVLHHELHHCTEYALWGNMFYQWHKWEKRNTRKFEYGTGGAYAYEQENKSIDWSSLSHPKKGFVNLYSTLGQEEDRSEIFAILMTDQEREWLIKECKKDRKLRRKVKLIQKTLNSFIGVKVAYWSDFL